MATWRPCVPRPAIRVRVRVSPMVASRAAGYMATHGRMAGWLACGRCGWPGLMMPALPCTSIATLQVYSRRRGVPRDPAIDDR